MTVQASQLVYTSGTCPPELKGLIDGLGDDKLVMTLLDALGESPEALRGFLVATDTIITLLSVYAEMGDADMASFGLAVTSLAIQMTETPAFAALLAREDS